MRLQRGAEGGGSGGSRSGRGGACREDAVVETEAASVVKKLGAECWREKKAKQASAQSYKEELEWWWVTGSGGRRDVGVVELCELLAA
jgi:hypothetical protein